MKFSNSDEIGNYVYSLSDPETNKIFYIGRGVGNRVFQHAKNADDLNIAPTDKIEKIREIHSKNKQVVFLHSWSFHLPGKKSQFVIC